MAWQFSWLFDFHDDRASQEQASKRSQRSEVFCVKYLKKSLCVCLENKLAKFLIGLTEIVLCDLYHAMVMF